MFQKGSPSWKGGFSDWSALELGIAWIRHWTHLYALLSYLELQIPLINWASNTGLLGLFSSLLEKLRQHDTWRRGNQEVAPHQAGHYEKNGADKSKFCPSSWNLEAPQQGRYTKESDSIFNVCWQLSSPTHSFFFPSCSTSGQANKKVQARSPLVLVGSSNHTSPDCWVETPTLAPFPDHNKSQAGLLSLFSEAFSDLVRKRLLSPTH